MLKKCKLKAVMGLWRNLAAALDLGSSVFETCRFESDQAYSKYHAPVVELADTLTSKVSVRENVRDRDPPGVPSPFSPVDRGTRLKICKAWVRIPQGVQATEETRMVASELRLMGYSFRISRGLLLVESLESE
jgi:hypothetical protein